MPEMTNVAAIRAFFEANGGRKVTMDEVKALSAEDRQELGDLARAALAS